MNAGKNAPSQILEEVLNVLLPKSKVNVRCPKGTLDAAKYNVNVGVMF